MSGPLVVSIPHRLGKDEALRRLKNGLGSASANFGHVFKIQEEIWTGPHLQYRISALGQVASGTIDVAEDYVRLEVFLPWLLAKLAETLQPPIRWFRTVAGPFVRIDHDEARYHPNGTQ